MNVWKRLRFTLRSRQGPTVKGKDALTWRGLLACALCMGTATVVQAQEVASSLEQLRLLLKPGDTVTVTDTSGQEVTGTIAHLSSASLRLIVNGARRDVAEAEVRLIRRNEHASLVTGAKWGFGIGAAVGLVGVLATGCCNQDAGGPWLIPLAVGLYGGIGSGIGVATSASIRTQHVVYVKPGASSAKLTLTPLMIPRRQGLLLSVGF